MQKHQNKHIVYNRNFCEAILIGKKTKNGWTNDRVSLTMWLSEGQTGVLKSIEC